MPLKSVTCGNIQKATVPKRTKFPAIYETAYSFGRTVNSV